MKYEKWTVSLITGIVIVVFAIFYYGCGTQNESTTDSASPQASEQSSAWKFTVDIDNATLDISAAGDLAVALTVDGHSVELINGGAGCLWSSTQEALTCQIEIINRDSDECMYNVHTKLHDSTNINAIVDRADYTWPGPLVCNGDTSNVENRGNCALPINDAGYCFTEDGLGGLPAQGCGSDYFNYIHPSGKSGMTFEFTNVPSGSYTFWTNIYASYQSCPYYWTDQIGGEGNDNIADVTVDDSGNIYITGYFGGSVNFAADFRDTDVHVAHGGTYDKDIFVTKINADYSYGWTRTMGDWDEDEGHAVTTDSAGNIYVTGYFKETVNFAESWAGDDTKTSPGGENIFITRINADGSYAWTRAIGKGGPSYGNDVATDTSGNIFATGEFWGDTVNFAEDWGGSDLKTSAGKADIYIMRINADGSYGWAKRIGNTGLDRGFAITVDSSGKIYVTGDFYHYATNFAEDWGGSDIKTPVSNYEAFVTSLSDSGTYGWTRKIGGDHVDRGKDIALDTSGNIYIAGELIGSGNYAQDFGGSDIVTSAGSYDGFIMRINSDLSYGWTRRIGADGTDLTNALVLSGSNIFFSGAFSNTVNFAADWSGNDSKTSLGSWDAFVSRIGTDGSYGWTMKMGQSSTEDATGISLDASGSLLVSGKFGSSVDFGLDFGTRDVKTAPAFGSEAFLTRINPTQ